MILAVIKNGGPENNRTNIVSWIFSLSDNRVRIVSASLFQRVKHGVSPENWARILVSTKKQVQTMGGSSPSRSATFLLSLFLMWLSVVKCGRLWPLNSKLNFSELFMTIPNHTYGPEISPEEYLVSHSSFIPTSEGTSHALQQVDFGRFGIKQSA